MGALTFGHMLILGMCTLVPVALGAGITLLVVHLRHR